jgi:uncharacterized coiled-coil protein SlyX
MAHETKRFRLLALGSFVALAAGSTGCASELIPPPVLSDAPLGRVIIYRNGVAYFERYGAPEEETLSMRVPAERVDDFLKSLTIIDERTGEAMPASFPTVEPSGGNVEMKIKLPKDHGRLRISYVTESPAWKPSYRVVLGDKGKSRLQAWAVVDNVSGEDWKQVHVGVGSTSALSFRYDLHSVRLVERETLTAEGLLALAPPTGGSPYAVGGKQLKVMGNISMDDLAQLEKDKDAERNMGPMAKADAKKRPAGGPQGAAAGEYWRDELGNYRPLPDQSARPSKGTPRARAPQAELPGDVDGSSYGAGGLGVSGSGPGGGGQAQLGDLGAARGYGQPSTAPAGKTGHAATPTPKPTVLPSAGQDRGRQTVLTLASQLRSSNERVRIEGFAQTGDKDGRQASLARANALREQLISNGVPPANIDAIGTGRVSSSEAVRIVAADEEDQKAQHEKGNTPPVVEGQPLGSAHFVSALPMTIDRDHSAMVNILNTEAEAERIYFYDPISARGSTKFAFNAVRLKNPSGYTLDSGPVTVYTGGQFLGEGLSEAILPHSVAFIPYALDRSILCDPEVTTREEIDKLLTIQRGIVTTETQLIRKTKLTLTNRGTAAAKIYIRHQVQPGYELRKGTLTVEKLAGAHLFPVTVAAGQALELVIEESTPIEKVVDIRSKEGIGAIELYLQKAHIGPELKGKLDDIVKTYSKMADLEERMEVLDQQTAVYRTRVDELNVQLVTLKKVSQAQKLSKHLSDKMQEISEKLQQATMQMSDLKGQHMALRIELQDKLSELTLKKDKGAAGDKPAPGPGDKPPPGTSDGGKPAAATR